MPAQGINKNTQKYKDTLTFKETLNQKIEDEKKALKTSFPTFHKMLTEKEIDLSGLRDHSTKLVGAGLLTGTLLLNSPNVKNALPAPHELIENLGNSQDDEDIANPQEVLWRGLNHVLPDKPRPLTREEEKHVERLVQALTDVPAVATLEGEHLNTTYGYIGAEQHLYRYPGDTLTNHGEGDVLREGIAPGLGAWGYFAQSKDELTDDLVETEKWYAVVQTMYLPDWNERVKYLREWYKYRKVLIVNVDNGNAVVAAIADAGPAAWTGKHFGGSPEVMDHLGGPRYKKGAVILYFVDDPNNEVPLGPVDYNQVKATSADLIAADDIQP